MYTLFIFGTYHEEFRKECINIAYLTFAKQVFEGEIPERIINLLDNSNAKPLEFGELVKELVKETGETSEVIENGWKDFRNDYREISELIDTANVVSRSNPNSKDIVKREHHKLHLYWEIMFSFCDARYLEAAIAFRAKRALKSSRIVVWIEDLVRSCDIPQDWLSKRDTLEMPYEDRVYHELLYPVYYAVLDQIYERSHYVVPYRFDATKFDEHLSPRKYANFIIASELASDKGEFDGIYEVEEIDGKIDEIMNSVYWRYPKLKLLEKEAGRIRERLGDGVLKPETFEALFTSEYQFNINYYRGGFFSFCPCRNRGFRYIISDFRKTIVPK